MDDTIEILLYEILTSIETIQKYFELNPQNFAEFLINREAQIEVEKNLAVVGEAVHRIFKYSPRFELKSSAKIIEMRNRAVLDNEMISDGVMWAMVKKHLPLLKHEIDAYLSV